MFAREHVPLLRSGDKTRTRRVHSPDASRPLRWELGDLIWVRETWARSSDGAAYYAADYMHTPGGAPELGELGARWRWRPSIHMPRELARIWLVVTLVGVERLGDITEDEARREGYDSRAAFLHAFERFGSDGSNPLVCVLGIQPIEVPHPMVQLRLPHVPC